MIAQVSGLLALAAIAVATNPPNCARICVDGINDCGVPFGG